ncbi:cyclase family protein [Salinibacterium sp. ZJ454]|uniref:cyclase family protein n=1 Tax=Salinibacterium sp. ZJ454 TaxID=2708339 RepID=UPI001423D030|nr:cyclase family protein [Salinibacterium sp. ZJ454]
MLDTQLMTDEELPAVFEAVSNWGRWGADDERGTVNLITPEVTARAAAEIREGVTVGFGSIDLSGSLASAEPPTRHVMLKDGEDAGKGYASATDFVGIDYHGVHTSHFDALCHVFYDGRMYNDRPAGLVRSTGAEANTIKAFRDGIATRGVLLDIPAVRGTDFVDPLSPVVPDDLDAALAAQSTEIREGDALFIYVGRSARRAATGSDFVEGALHVAGLDASCLPWLHEKGIAVLGSDGANDALPRQAGAERVPVHVGAIVYMGMPLLDNAALDALAGACRARSRWNFFTAITPLAISGGTGSPVNPVAIF